MTAKKLLFFLFFCVCLSEIIATFSEEELKKWSEKIINDYTEECKHTISEESLQELKDDMLADNEEIRSFRNCILIEMKYVDNSKMNMPKMLDDAMKNLPSLNLMEIKTLEQLGNICKLEAEQRSDNDATLAGEFSNCSMDRFRSIS